MSLLLLRMGQFVFFIVWCTLITAPETFAAEIFAEKGTPPTIYLRGLIGRSDASRFDEAARQFDGALVVLQGQGGDLVTALHIGQEIQKRRFQTIVRSPDYCASACGYIWLAGSDRRAEPGALIGFHAAYRIGSDGQPIESGQGNALLGAYLNRLGLNDWAIMYLTEAGPTGMSWLTDADAKRLGIQVVWTAPNTIVSTPSVEFTKHQIARILLKDKVMSTLNSSQPAVFKGFVNWAFNEQLKDFDPLNIEAGLAAMMRKVISSRLATAMDSTIDMVARADYHRLQYFSEQHPALCVADFFGDGLTPEYVKAIGKMPDWIRSEVANAVGDLFFTRGAPRKIDSTAAEKIRARLLKRLARKFDLAVVKEALDSSGGLRNSNPKLVCEIGVSFFQSLMSLPEGDVATFLMWQVNTR